LAPEQRGYGSHCSNQILKNMQDADIAFLVSGITM